MSGKRSKRGGDSPSGRRQKVQRGSGSFKRVPPAHEIKQLCIEQVDRDDPYCYYDSREECGKDPISWENPIEPVVRIRNRHALQCIGLENLYTHLSGQQVRGIPRTDVLTRTPFTARQLEYISTAHRDNIPEGERKDMVWLREENEEIEESEENEDGEEAIRQHLLEHFADNVFIWDDQSGEPLFVRRTYFDRNVVLRGHHPIVSDGDMTERISQIINQFRIVALNVQRADIDEVIVARRSVNRGYIFLLLDHLLDKAIAAIPVSQERVDFVGRIPPERVPQPFSQHIILEWVRESFPFVDQEFYKHQPYEFWANHFFNMIILCLAYDQARGFGPFYKNLYWYLYEEQGRRRAPPEPIFPVMLNYLNNRQIHRSIPVLLELLEPYGPEFVTRARRVLQTII